MVDTVILSREKDLFTVKLNADSEYSESALQV